MRTATMNFATHRLMLLIMILLTCTACPGDDGVTGQNMPMDEETVEMDEEPQGTDDGEAFRKVVSITTSGVDEGDFYGFDMATTPEFTAVSAPRNDTKGNRTGAIYIFMRSGTDFEGVAATIYPENATDEDHFGWSIDIDGSTLVIGAPQNDKYGEDAGMAYVYEHIGDNQWALAREIEAPNPQEGMEFGNQVAVDGGTILVGSVFDEDNYFDDGPINNGAGFAQGSVFVFEKNTDWEYLQKLLPNDDQGHKWDAFGSAVAIDNTILAVGAKGTDNINKNPGGVYVFEKQGGEWIQTQRLTADDGTSEDFFGAEIALDGNYLGITAPGSFNSLVPNQNVPHGAAYVFTRTGSDWVEEKKIVAAGSVPEDAFGGGDIDWHEDFLVVGAPLEKVVTDNNGVVYFFNRDANWSESHSISAPNPLNEDLFGSAISVTNDLIFVGAHRRCNETGCWAGATYFVQ